MKRMLIGLVCALALVCAALTASAEPAITRNGYTAYLGAENHLYLVDPTGKAQVLEKPIGDIVDLTDTLLYCVSTEGQLISISLDGTQSSYLSQSEPTQEQLDAITSEPLYTLDGTTLTIPAGAETNTALSTTAIVACTNGETLFWIEAGVAGSTTLKSLQLNMENAPTQVIGDGVTSPLSMIATDDTLTMVAGDHTVTVVTLLDRGRQTYPATSQLTTHAVSIGGQLVRYDKDIITGKYTTEASIQPLTLLTPVTTSQSYVAPGASTATPTTQPTVTPTLRPQVTTAPSSSSSGSTSTSDDTLRKGDKGSEVRKMQKRLSELGYPVGVIDGVWGDDTQLAVNLFQCAIGYTERDYATSGMLKKLYAKNAPVYDPYAPLKKGDRGTDVLLMQSTLAIMGYNPGKLDGVYGANTVAAVSRFQQVAGYPITGEADATTLKLLYSLDCPLNPDVYPTATPVPTEAPTETPTAAPTEAPTETPTTEPTNAPAEEPTTEPTNAPTEEPTAEPTQAPTEEPTAEPTQAPTEEPTAEPTQAPTEEPTAEPAQTLESVTLAEMKDDPKVGDELQVQITPAGLSVTYQWYRYNPDGDDIAIDRATASTYELTQEDVGYRLYCKVTASGVTKKTDLTKAIIA